MLIGFTLMMRPYSAGVNYLVFQKVRGIYHFGSVNSRPNRTKEAHQHIFIEEQKQLYTGALIPNPYSFRGTTLSRAIISCVSCDIPATRKVCGFYGQDRSTASLTAIIAFVFFTAPQEVSYSLVSVLRHIILAFLVPPQLHNSQS